MRIAETRQKVYIKMCFLTQKFGKTEEKEGLSEDERKIHFRRGFLSATELLFLALSAHLVYAVVINSVVCNSRLCYFFFVSSLNMPKAPFLLRKKANVTQAAG